MVNQPKNAHPIEYASQIAIFSTADIEKRVLQKTCRVQESFQAAHRHKLFSRVRLSTLMSRPSDCLDHLTKQVREFITERDWEQFQSCKNLAISIMLESAELLELFQWTDPTHEEVKQDPVLTQKISDELADIAIYVINFASQLELDLGAQILTKIKKNAEKYPIPTSSGREEKYHEYITKKEA